MSKKTIIFQEYGEVSIKEVDELFCFTILYHDKCNIQYIIKQSEFVIVAVCRGLSKICLEKIANKDYLFITDNVNNIISSPKQINDFLLLQCDKNEEVTTKMLYHAILDSINDLFPKIRLSDIFYNYKWHNQTNDEMNEFNIYTDSLDKYISNFFPSGKDDAIEKIILNLGFSKQDAIILFERWQKFYLIDYSPYEEWVPNPPKDTFTIEQFKEVIPIKTIDVKKDESSGELFFEAGNVKGKVSIKGIPKHPMISLFITSDSNEHWLLHEEGSIFQAPVIAKF